MNTTCSSTSRSRTPRLRRARAGGRRERDAAIAVLQRVAAEAGRELVAEGRSNKQVAAALFLSEKTIEHNLSRVYAKLGVRSRVELAAGSCGSPGRVSGRR